MKDTLPGSRSKPPSRLRLSSLILVLVAFILTLIILAAASVNALTYPGDIIGGPVWGLPIFVWIAVAALAAMSIFYRTPIVGTITIALFGVAIIGGLGYLEPLGVFHDTWQNVGLGQLTMMPSQISAARQIPYVASSPVTFLFFGVLRSAFPDTPSFLRIYPTFCVFIYCAGLYELAVAFCDVNPDLHFLDHSRFGLLSVFAFFALAANLSVRVNPAPQSLAFALMPFCLAALMKGAQHWRYRAVAVAIFIVIVFSHVITSIMIIALGLVWWGLDRLLYRRSSAPVFVSRNTAALYGSVFLGWLIYVGVWTLQTGKLFAQRIIEVINSGQHATVTATVTEQSEAFVWVHRVALAGSAVLVLVGLILMLRASQRAGIRLIAWLGVSSALLPFVFFGEFADRGPLFASLPAALAVGFLLGRKGNRYGHWAASALMLLATVTSFVTAYSSHIGEVLTEEEVTAFHVLVTQNPDQWITYSYTLPFTGSDLPVYGLEHSRTFSLGAADFSYQKLTSTPGIIVISEQMRQAAAARGPQALAQLEQFEMQLQRDPHYELVFNDGYIRAYRARQK